MNRKINSIVIKSAAVAALSLAGTQISSAVPIAGTYIEDPRCDVIPLNHPTHELGELGFFPTNEAFTVIINPTNKVVCVADDLVQNDWEVQIRNVSGIAWYDLFFVADLGLNVGNADGSMVDNTNAAFLTDAFKIDGTVTVTGLNDNLSFESGVVNEIFEPFESWTFYVTNFTDTAGIMPPPIFRSPGVFAGSSPYTPGSIGTASILATPIVPEPTSLGLLAIFSGMLLMRRRHAV